MQFHASGPEDQSEFSYTHTPTRKGLAREVKPLGHVTSCLREIPQTFSSADISLAENRRAQIIK